MKITLNNGKPLNSELSSAIETALKCRLSASFLAFLKQNDGAKPSTNIFKIPSGNESGVNQFIPASEILKERARIENIPEKAYPIAWAEGGNYVFIDEAKAGAVFFWDHEVPERTAELAPDFGVFLDRLEPFDPKSITLKPGQVKRAWIDPEFLKRIQK